SIGDVELIIFVVEGTHWNEDDEMVLNKVRQSGRPVLLVMNKIDQVKDRDLVLPHMQFLGNKFDFVGIIPVSAKQGKNIELIKQEVTKRLPLCEFYFPEDYVTDRSMRFMAAEVIREKLMRFMGDELPYSVTVEIEQFKWQENGVWQINGLILVERETQKRMVIGNKGEKLKVIGREARKDLEGMLDNKVFLELWVKVKSGWADDERALRSLGYGED
ncbi:MAG: GTPase Era, partial [Pseudomonadota bacterium]